MATKLRPSPLVIAAGEGLGNNFWLASAVEIAATGVGASDLAKQVCAEPHPRDGLLLVHEPAEAQCGFDGKRIERRRIEVFNRDGSDGGTCLNGLRVVAKWLGGDYGELEMAGRRVPWRRHGGHVELHLSVDTLKPTLWQPQQLEVMGLPALAVDFWNPHCVIDTPEPRAIYLPAFAAAARERKDLFPDGVNVEVVRLADLSMRVDERGVGETQACGSGAVAVAVAVWSGLLDPGSNLRTLDGTKEDADLAEKSANREALTVQMPGGNLSLSRAPDGGILLRGDATATSFDRN